MKIVDNAKRATMNKLIDYIVADPKTNIKTAVNTLDTFLPSSLFAAQRGAIQQAVEQENNWYQLILRAAELNPEFVPTFLKALLTAANILAWDEQEKNREKYGCNVPWAIPMDPTSACNLHCIGCWVPVAEAIWTDESDERAKWRARQYQGISDADIHRIERRGRVMHGVFDADRDLTSVVERR